MTFAEIKRETLSHIMQYSIGGTEISSSYNDHADRVNRIPSLINEGLVNIRTYVRPMPEVLMLSPENGKSFEKMLAFEMPSNLWSLKSGCAYALDGDRMEKTNDVRILGKNTVIVPDNGKSYLVEYYKYPPQLPMNVSDDYNLDEDLEVIQTATYYAAAQLVLYDDAFQYASLYNDYESRVSRMVSVQRVEIAPVADAYNFSPNLGV